MQKGKSYKTWSTAACAAESRRRIPCNLCGGTSFVPSLSCEGFDYAKCTGCGLVQQNPQPEAEPVHARYSAVQGEDYLSYELANEAAFLALQQKTLKDAHFDIEEKRFFAMSKNSRPPRFLDAGCATGALLAFMRERGWEAQGVEISAQMAEYARHKRGLDVQTLPLEEACFPDGYFDCVHASHLIEHLNDPRSFVREAFRILQKGGVFLVTTPNIAGLQARFAKSAWRSAIYDHLYLFSKRTLCALLLQEGFTVEMTVTWGGIPLGAAPLPLKKLADNLVKKIGAGDVVFIKAIK